MTELTTTGRQTASTGLIQTHSHGLAAGTPGPGDSESSAAGTIKTNMDLLDDEEYLYNPYTAEAVSFRHHSMLHYINDRICVV